MILLPAALTPSGRPVLQPGEVEVSLLDKVDLEFHPRGGLAGRLADRYRDGYAILTKRRLIWVDAAATSSPSSLPAPPPAPGAPAGRTLCLPLASIAAASRRVQYALSGSKVRLVLEVYTDAQQQPVPASGFHARLDLLSLRCRGAPPDAFKARLEELVRQAAAASNAAGAGAAGSGVAAGAAAPGPGGRGAGGGGHSPAAAAASMSPLSAGLASRAAAAAAGKAAGNGVAAGGAPMAASPSPAAAASPDAALLQSMVEMGFPRNRSARALLATRNEGLQPALDYLLAFGDQPGMDDALSTPSPPPQQPGPGPARYPSLPPAAPHLPPPPPPAPSPYGGYGSGAASPAPYDSQAGLASLYDGMGQLSLHSPYGAAGGAAGGGGGLGPHFSSAPDLQAAGGGGAQHGDGGAAGGPASGPVSRTIGVAGIVRREQQKTEESGRAVEQAFKDLSALMSHAATIVELAHKFRGVLGQGQGQEGGGGEAPQAAGHGDGGMLLDRETQEQLIALGIASPVTRETAGARYHTELSRQLADFLAGPLARAGGLLPLPDCYCLFNRARGTELVSPDDLLQAVRLFGQAGVTGLRLRRLASGVLVVQGPQHSEEQICARIAELVRQPPKPTAPTATPTATPTAPTAPTAIPHAPGPPLGPGLTPSDLAAALGGAVAVTIAAEHLAVAEAAGVVCRDEGPEGTTHYANFFAGLDPGRMAEYCRAA